RNEAGGLENLDVVVVGAGNPGHLAARQTALPQAPILRTLRGTVARVDSGRNACGGLGGERRDLSGRWIGHERRPFDRPPALGPELVVRTGHVGGGTTGGTCVAIAGASGCERRRLLQQIGELGIRVAVLVPKLLGALERRRRREVPD